jgi:hypothetical protein
MSDPLPTSLPFCFSFPTSQAHIKDSETINRLIGGTEKTLMFEVVRVYGEYFREDLVAEIAKAYPNQEEYVAYVTAWITMPEIPFLLDRVE